MEFVNTNEATIGKERLHDLIDEYVTLIETEPTRASCRCTWPVDDTAPMAGIKLLRNALIAPDCPVHTKEGFLAGFFGWFIAMRYMHQRAYASAFHSCTFPQVEVPYPPTLWKPTEGDDGPK